MRSRQQQGFSLLEILIVMGIMGVISAGILSQMNEAQQRGYSEQVKLDNFQEARDFVDQFFRDINQIGYPSSRLVDPASLLWVPALSAPSPYGWTSPYINDNRLAIGLVSINRNAIQFEGDMIGNGVVQSVIYQVNGSSSCLLCLQRSQVDKVAGNPLPPTSAGAQGVKCGTEVNDVLSDPIFTYFQADGTQIVIPPSSPAIDISTSARAVKPASIKNIQIILTSRNNSLIDCQ